MEEFSAKTASESYDDYLAKAKKLANPNYSFDKLYEVADNLYVRYQAELELLQKFKAAEINTKEMHRRLRKYDKKMGKKDVVQKSTVEDTSRILTSQYTTVKWEVMGEELYEATVLAHKLLARERALKTLMGELKSSKRRCENFVRDGME